MNKRRLKGGNTFQVKDGREVWFDGHVIIDGVEHRIANGFVICDSSLNNRAWFVTEKKSVCQKCFPQLQTELQF